MAAAVGPRLVEQARPNARQVLPVQAAPFILVDSFKSRELEQAQSASEAGWRPQQHTTSRRLGNGAAATHVLPKQLDQRQGSLASISCCSVTPN